LNSDSANTAYQAIVINLVYRDAIASKRVTPAFKPEMHTYKIVPGFSQTIFG